MALDERERLVLQQRAIDALRDRVVADSYMSVGAVCARLGLSRETVEALPIEILPFSDYGSPARGDKPGRHLKRYHPADVLAVDARVRAWRRAQQKNEGEAYLQGLRAELEARDTLARDIARDMVQAVA